MRSGGGVATCTQESCIILRISFGRACHLRQMFLRLSSTVLKGIVQIPKRTERARSCCDSDSFETPRIWGSYGGFEILSLLSVVVGFPWELVSGRGVFLLENFLTVHIILFTTSVVVLLLLLTIENSVQRPTFTNRLL